MGPVCLPSLQFMLVLLLCRSGEVTSSCLLGQEESWLDGMYVRVTGQQNIVCSLSESE